MTIYRGPGGTGEARTDSDVTEVRIIADEAEGYKDQAATSASAAASSASAAATAETNAETAEANAETAEANAEAAQAAAEAAQAAAEAAQAAAEAVYDDFDDRYLGAKSSNPSVDNDGDALTAGALYFNTTVPEMRVYTGSAWTSLGASSGVASFNTRTGAVTLTDTDVNTALGYTAANDSAVVKLTGNQTVAGTKTFSNNAVISVTDNTNAALRITQLGTGNALLVEDSTNPDSTPFVVTADGTTLVGLATPSTTGVGSAKVQIAGGTAPLSLIRQADSSTAINLEFAKSRASGAILNSGDTIGRLYFSGSDGTAQIPAAYIDAAVDGTPGTNDMPGCLVFSTTADGASSPTERMRITNSGNVGIGKTPTTALDVNGTITATTFAGAGTSLTGTAASLSIGGNAANVTGTVAVANGGTGSTTASAARTALGVAIGTDVQAYDADLTTWAGKTAPSGIVVGTSDTQTLSNKTFSGAQTFGSASLAEPSGSAPLYLCRAWVNFNGTGTVAIRASGNVSSITDNGTGDYTVNFTTAMADANYSATALLNGGSGGNVMAPYTTTAPTTSAYRLGTRRTDTFAASDTEYVNVAFFR